MRLTFALIVFAWASGLIAQESSGYIETNVGVSYTNAEVDSLSRHLFLYGRRMFLSNTSFWDAQIGLAAPSVATTKVGWGYRRPSPISAYLLASGFGRLTCICSSAFPTNGVLMNCPIECSAGLTGEEALNDLVCGEWTLSLEGGLGGTRWENFSLESIAIATVSHRWYFE